MASQQTKTKAKAPAVEGVVVPDGAKVPQDHKGKAGSGPDTITATVRGVDFTVPRDALDDFELLDDLNALDQRGDATRLPSILRRLLGDQWRAAMDLLRDERTGRISIESGGQFVSELMEELNPNS